MYRHGVRYILAEMTPANDRTANSWARNDDITENPSNEDGDAKGVVASGWKHEDEKEPQHLDPIEEGSESVCSTVEDVQKFLLQNAIVDLRGLETQMMTMSANSQATATPGNFRNLSGSFRSTPVAGDEERLATPVAMSVEADDEECTHPSVDALIMLGAEQRQASLVKWPVDPIKNPTTCDVCELVIRDGEGYKRCRMCNHTCCRKCEWTLKHPAYPHD